MSRIFRTTFRFGSNLFGAISSCRGATLTTDMTRFYANLSAQNLRNSLRFGAEFPYWIPRTQAVKSDNALEKIQKVQ